VADQVEEDECGAVTSSVRETLAEQAVMHPNIAFLADSRRRIRRFRRLVVKPNQFEAVGRENPGPDEQIPLDSIAKALPRLRNEVSAPVLVTLGARGMIASDPEPVYIPAVRVEGPTDPTGAGDSFIAGAALSVAAGATLPEACLIGNLVASITIEQLATTGTAQPDQLAPRLDEWRAQHCH